MKAIQGAHFLTGSGERMTNKILPSAIAALLLFTACAGQPVNQTVSSPKTPGTPEKQDFYIVSDYKNKARGGAIPEWVRRWQEEGIRGVEALDSYKGEFVFISRNEGNNFNALTQWAEGFNTELDFPRLASARIGARFLSGVPFPDEEYGNFFEALIRAASDAPWKSAIRKDDFWLRRKQITLEETNFGSENQTKEIWEYLILVTIEKPLFSSQLTEVFLSADPNPRLTKEQNTAVNRVKDRFYEGF